MARTHGGSARTTSFDGLTRREATMPKMSAGILLFKRTPSGLLVLLVHPGGPFFARKDEGAWTIPKGEVEPGEALIDVALREFAEETGTRLPAKGVVALGEIRQAGGKIVHGFAVEGDIDAGAIVSNVFEIEWPPRSGRRQSFPEVDRAGWFTLDEARARINPAQRAFLDRISAEIR